MDIRLFFHKITNNNKTTNTEADKINEGVNVNCNGNSCNNDECMNDSGKNDKNNIGASDISKTANDAPFQPSLSNYPKTKFGKQYRCFSKNWFQKFDWLEYSVKQDKAYCYICRHFALEAWNHYPIVLAKSGLNDWRNAVELFKEHITKPGHKDATAKMMLFRKTNNENRVDILLQNRARTTILKNREYLKSIIQSLLFLSKQELSYRGHDESVQSNQNGNFKELLKYTAEKDVNFKQQLQSRPQNAKYTSPEIQNELLNICANQVIQKILRDAKESKYYSLIVDESLDISTVEQLSIIIRFVHNNKIQERFLGFISLEKTNAETIFTTVKNKIIESGLSFENLISQCYDGAATMSGVRSGVQTRIKELAPQAAFIHCCAHNLNLALVSSVSANFKVKLFFGYVQSLYTFITASGKRFSIYNKIQSNMLPIIKNKQNMRLKCLSETRWSCQAEALKAIRILYHVILATLDEIQRTDSDAKVVSEANGYLQQIKKDEFKLFLIICEDLFTKTKILCDTLQSVNIDFAKAMRLVDSVTANIQDLRNEEAFNRFYARMSTDFVIDTVDEISDTVVSAKNPNEFESTTTEAETVNSTTKKRKRKTDNTTNSPVTTSKRQRKANSKYDDHAHTQHVFSIMDEFRANYYELVDRMLQELKTRFSKEQRDVYNALKILEMKEKPSDFRSQLEHLCKVVNANIDINTLTSEYEICYIYINSLPQQSKTITEIYFELCDNLLVNISDKHLMTCSNLMDVFQRALTIAITSCSPERSFSAMKRIKSYLRSTMGQDRLSSLAILSIESDEKIDIEKVIDEFCAVNPRRILLE